MRVSIITDSTCDLSKELVEKHNIKVVPLYVNFNNDSYLDGVDIDVPTLFKKVDELGVLPKTSAIAPARFMEIFQEELNLGNEVVYLGIGSGFSSSHQNAVNVARELDEERIHVFDSRNLSTGTGLMVLKACKYRDMGYSGKQIVEELEKVQGLVRTQFSINTLEYLHKGGRCSGVARFFGTMLSMKPIIRVVDGAMVVAQKPIGKYEKALNRILDYVRHDIDNIDPDYLMITHCAADDDAKYLRNCLSQMNLKVDHIEETKAGCVVGSHCGPRTIGILYILKK